MTWKPCCCGQPGCCPIFDDFNRSDVGPNYTPIQGTWTLENFGGETTLKASADDAIIRRHHSFGLDGTYSIQAKIVSGEVARLFIGKTYGISEAVVLGPNYYDDMARGYIAELAGDIVSLYAYSGHDIDNLQGEVLLAKAQLYEIPIEYPILRLCLDMQNAEGEQSHDMVTVTVNGRLAVQVGRRFDMPFDRTYAGLATGSGGSGAVRFTDLQMCKIDWLGEPVCKGCHTCCWPFDSPSPGWRFYDATGISDTFNIYFPHFIAVHIEECSDLEACLGGGGKCDELNGTWILPLVSYDLTELGVECPLGLNIFSGLDATSCLHYCAADSNLPGGPCGVNTMGVVIGRFADPSATGHLPSHPTSTWDTGASQGVCAAALRASNESGSGFVVLDAQTDTSIDAEAFSSGYPHRVDLINGVNLCPSCTLIYFEEILNP